LFIGNSITLHAPKPDIGWNNNWGMAASSEENDYVHRLMQKVRDSQPEAGFCIAQAAEWEWQYWQGEEVLPKYQEAAAYDPHVMILRIAENVPRDKADQLPFAPCYEALLRYFDPGQNARIILTTSFWPAGPIDEAIREVAHKLDLPLVELGHLGVQDSMKALGLFEHSGVAAHPGDAGMEAIAEAIWPYLEEALSEK